MFISTELNAYLTVLKGADFEDNVPHMYLDSVAQVTVGVGHNISAHKDLKELSFTVRRLQRKPVEGSTDTGAPVSNPQTIGRLATDLEKQNDYDFLVKHSNLKGYKKHYQMERTTLGMEPTAIDALFADDVQVAISDLQSIFGPIFSDYPVPAQAALIDMMFNLGKPRFLRYHHLIAAVKGAHPYEKSTAEQRWTAAAKDSHRNGIQESRNTQIANWFKQAAKRPALANACPAAPMPLHLP